MSFNVPTNFASRPVAVIGAGTLGRRIALMSAAHGAQVRIHDLAEAQRRAAVDYVSQNLPALADRLTGVVPGRVSAEADLADAVHNAWLVVEAIPELLELKSRCSDNSTSCQPSTPSLPAIRRPMPAGCSWTRSTAPSTC
jgi:3-hydroxybutyryl-CoA dehydrogenase